MQRSPSLPVAAVALALLIALAGCNLPGGTASPAAPSDEVTPAPVPDEQYPPGLETAGIRDARQLATTHASRVQNRSLAVRYERRTALSNGSTATWSRGRMRMAEGWERFAGSTARGGVRVGDYRASVFANDTRRFVRQTRDGETSYRIDDGPSPLSAWLVEQRLPELLLAFERATVERTDTDTLRFRISGTVADDSDVLREEPAGNATATAVVGGDGVIRRARVAYDIEDPRSPGKGRVVETIEIRGLDNTTVERPAWTADAVAAISADRPAGLGDGRVTDPDALLDGHRAALAGEQVQVNRDLRRSDSDGVDSELVRRERALVGGERRTFYRSVTVRPEGETRLRDHAVWSNRTVAVTERFVNDSTARYGLREPVAFSVTNAVGPPVRDLRDVLAGLGDVNVEFRNGQYAIVAESVADPGLVVRGESGSGGVANVSATVYVTREGMVDGVTVEYDDLASDTRVVERLSYDDVRPGPVPQPSWVRAELDDREQELTPDGE